jgi:hypothetical protein
MLSRVMESRLPWGKPKPAPLGSDSLLVTLDLAGSETGLIVLHVHL